jgi:hypothetical protein
VEVVRLFTSVSPLTNSPEWIFLNNRLGIFLFFRCGISGIYSCRRVFSHSIPVPMNCRWMPFYRWFLCLNPSGGTDSFTYFDECFIGFQTIRHSEGGGRLQGTKCRLQGTKCRLIKARSADSKARSADSKARSADSKARSADW